MQHKKTLALASAMLAAVLGLGACSSDGSGSTEGTAGSGAGSPASTAHNKADTAFAQEMIPHHAQAIDMAKLAMARAAGAEVRKLAADIEAAQRPEIATMTGWLKAWGEKVPSTGMAGMPGMGHGRGGEPGMMTPQEMDRLEKAHGADFDRMFLQMMIKHHQGALEMARTERAQGRNDEAVKLAQGIQAAQTEEIAKMRQMLKS